MRSTIYPLTASGAIPNRQITPDDLHPNDAGHERMAKTIMYQLSALPCTF